VQRVHDLAEDVELKLRRRRVPDASRHCPRSPAATQRPTRHEPLAGHPVQDLRLRQVAGDRAAAARQARPSWPPSSARRVRTSRP
jgi:hypothetical protein